MYVTSAAIILYLSEANVPLTYRWAGLSVAFKSFPYFIYLLLFLLSWGFM